MIFTCVLKTIELYAGHNRQYKCLECLQSLEELGWIGTPA